FPVGSSDTPEGARATQPSVGLAPGGVCRAPRFPGTLVRSLTFSPVPSSDAGQPSLFCGTFPRLLGAAVSGHLCPVESGLSSGVLHASDRATSFSPRAILALRLGGFQPLGPPEEDAMAIRAEPDLARALQFVEELRREVHVTTKTGPVADFDDSGAAAAFENLLIFLEQGGV